MEKQIITTVKKIVPAVISIVISKSLTGETKETGSEGKRIKTGGGSGFIIDSSGIILTNRHVVNDPLAEYVAVLNNNEKYPAKVLAKDPINDIAVLKIDAKNLPTLKLGDSTKLELGQTVIAVGNVLGAFKNTVSAGIISGLSREITADSEIEGKITKLQGLIQTDAAINPGNSGGPLTDIKGQVVGINAAMVLGAENIGFTLPINAAKKDLIDIKKYGKIRQPFLGVRYISLNKKLKEKYNFPIDYGALVISEFLPKGKAVLPNSPADKAGIKEADIILEVNKIKLSPKKDLEDILRKFKINDEIEIKILRGKKELNYKIVLTEKK